MGNGAVLESLGTLTLAGANTFGGRQSAVTPLLRNLGTLRTGPGGGLVQVAVDSPGPINVDQGDLYLGGTNTMNGPVTVRSEERRVGQERRLTGPAFAVAGSAHAQRRPA